MTHSTSRGLLYTTPPVENDEREKPTAERTESTAEGSNRGHVPADD